MMEIEQYVADTHDPVAVKMGSYVHICVDNCVCVIHIILTCL